MALVDGGGARPITPPPLPEAQWGKHPDDGGRAAQALAEQRSKLAAALRQAIAPDERALADLGQRAREALGRDADAAARAATAPDPPPPTADRAAAPVALAA